MPGFQTLIKIKVKWKFINRFIKFKKLHFTKLLQICLLFFFRDGIKIFILSKSQHCYGLVCELTKQLLQEINKYCAEYEAWQIILLTLITHLCLQYASAFVFDSELSLFMRTKQNFFYYIKKIPIVNNYIQKELGKVWFFSYSSFFF